MKKDLINLDAVEIYKLVLSGGLKRFPNGFWKQPEAKQNAMKCAQYLIEEILKWDKETIKEKLTVKCFNNNKLSTMMDIVYHSNVYDILNDIYPGEFKPWHVNRTHAFYWNKDTALEAIKYEIENKKWTRNDIKNKLGKSFFEETKLIYAAKFFNNIYEILNNIYPNEFKPWELQRCPNDFWTNDNIYMALDWLIEKEDFNINQLQDLLIKYNLQSLIAYMKINDMKIYISNKLK